GIDQRPRARRHQAVALPSPAVLDAAVRARRAGALTAPAGAFAARGVFTAAPARAAARCPAALAALDLRAARCTVPPVNAWTVSFSASTRATSSPISRLAGTPSRVSARETRSSKT